MRRANRIAPSAAPNRMQAHPQPATTWGNCSKLSNMRACIYHCPGVVLPLSVPPWSSAAPGVVSRVKLIPRRRFLIASRISRALMPVMVSAMGRAVALCPSADDAAGVAISESIKSELASATGDSPE